MNLEVYKYIARLDARGQTSCFMVLNLGHLQYTYNSLRSVSEENKRGSWDSKVMQEGESNSFTILQHRLSCDTQNNWTRCPLTTTQTFKVVSSTIREQHFLATITCKITVLSKLFL